MSNSDHDDLLSSKKSENQKSLGQSSEATYFEFLQGIRNELNRKEMLRVSPYDLSNSKKSSSNNQ